MTAYDRSLFWFRRDLRDDDNAGLHYALTSSRQVHRAFVFDRGILEALPSRADRRVEFIRECLVELREALRAPGGELIARDFPAVKGVSHLSVHNRPRMAVASFLVKDLLVDWRRGEKYFADHLLDFDLSANNGGW